MADQIVVSENALGYLRATRPWVKFLAIVGFVFIVLMVLIGLLMALALSGAAAKTGPLAAFGPILGVVYIVMAAVYLMPCLFMYRYAKAIAAIPGTGQAALEEALKQQKSFWKFMGILMLIILCLYALIFVGSIAFGVMAGMSAAHH